MKQLRVFNFNHEECVIAGAATPVPARTSTLVMVPTVQYNAYQASYGDPCAYGGVGIYDADSAHPALSATSRAMTAAGDIEATDAIVLFVNLTEDPYDATLPPAADYPTGQRLCLRFAGVAAGVPIVPQEAETVDDELDPVDLTTMLVLESDGISNWTTT